jgi:hypothetical protein
MIRTAKQAGLFSLRNIDALTFAGTKKSPREDVFTLAFYTSVKEEVDGNPPKQKPV